MRRGKQFETIDEYITTFPKDVQNILEKVRQTIRKAAPEAVEAISYQMPTFKLHGNLVHFAAYKSHIGLYPPPSSGDEAFERELSPYRRAKGTLRFPLDEPIPYDLKKIVQLRVQENREKLKRSALSPRHPRRTPLPRRARGR